MNATERRSHLRQVLAADDGERHATHVMQQNGRCGAPARCLCLRRTRKRCLVQACMKMGCCSASAFAAIANNWVLSRVQVLKRVQQQHSSPTLAAVGVECMHRVSTRIHTAIMLAPLPSLLLLSSSSSLASSRLTRLSETLPTILKIPIICTTPQPIMRRM